MTRDGHLTAGQERSMTFVDEFEQHLADSMRDPDFAGAYEDAGARYDLLAHLIEVRKALGLTQSQVAASMVTER